MSLSKSINIDRLKPILKLRENQPPNLTRGQTFSQPNHVQSFSIFQDIFLIIYQHDLWGQIWPHPTSLQSGTLNVLQAPNLGFLSQIMTNLDQTSRKGPSATNKILFDFQLTMTHTLSPQSGTFNVLKAPNIGFLSQIRSNLDQTFRIGPLATKNIIFDVQLDIILQISNQEPSTSSKPPCNQNLFLSW